MFKPIVHEFDPNSIYMRNIELKSHYKKLEAIKIRKNKLSKLTSDHINTSVEKKYKIKSPQRKITFDKEFNLNRANQVMSDKLFEISKKSLNNVKFLFLF